MKDKCGSLKIMCDVILVLLIWMRTEWSWQSFFLEPCPSSFNHNIEEPIKQRAHHSMQLHIILYNALLAALLLSLRVGEKWAETSIFGVEIVFKLLVAFYNQSICTKLRNQNSHTSLNWIPHRIHKHTVTLPLLNQIPNHIELLLHVQLRQRRARFLCCSPISEVP